MTKQEIFDKVAIHLLTQKTQSIEFGSCLYRGPGGLKCAAGCLIPDSIYNPKMEGQPALTLFSNTPGLDEFVEQARFIDNLQLIHDHEYPENWKDTLERMASWANLSSDILKNF